MKFRLLSRVCLTLSLIVFSTPSLANVCNWTSSKFISFETFELRLKHECDVDSIKNWNPSGIGNIGDIYVAYINDGWKNGGDNYYFKLENDNYKYLPKDKVSNDTWTYITSAKDSILKKSAKEIILEDHEYGENIDLNVELPIIFGTGMVNGWNSSGQGVPGDLYVTYLNGLKYYFQLKKQSYGYMRKDKVSDETWDFVADEVSFNSSKESTSVSVGNTYTVKRCDIDNMQNDYILTHQLYGNSLYWFKDCNLAYTAELPGTIPFAKQTDDKMLAFVNARVRGTTDQKVHLFNSDGSESFDSQKFREKDVVFPHHDIIKSKRGTYFLIMQKVVGPDNSRDDIVYEIDSNGNVLWKVSINTLIFGREDGAQDLAWGENWMHTNSLAEFSNGDLLVSARNHNDLVRVSYPEGKIVWKKGAEYLGLQHHASIINNDMIIVYNNGIDIGDYGNSETGIAAFDIDGEFLWEQKLGFTSDGYGSVELLENGNWLTIDGKGGRILEYSNDFSEIYFELEFNREVYLWWHSGSGDSSSNSLYRAQSVKKPFFY